MSPNPAGKTIQVYTNGFQQDKTLTISIISASGVRMEIIQSNASNKFVQQYVSSFVSGVYTVRVVSGTKVINRKFVKL